MENEGANLEGEALELQELKKVFEGLKNEMETLKVAKVDLERKLDEADSELLGDEYLNFKNAKVQKKVGNGDGDDGTKQSDGTEFDFDRASNKELASRLMGDSEKVFGGMMKKVEDRMNTAEERMGRAFAQIDVTIASMRHSDFEDNRKGIFEVAKKNPSWGAEQCYKQFRLEKHQSDTDKIEEDKEREVKERQLLTEKGGGMPAGTTQHKELSPEEAGELAYEKAFGNEKLDDE